MSWQAIWHLWYVAQVKAELGDVFYCLLAAGCWLPPHGAVL